MQKNTFVIIFFFLLVYPLLGQNNIYSFESIRSPYMGRVKKAYVSKSQLYHLPSEFDSEISSKMKPVSLSVYNEKGVLEKQTFFDKEGKETSVTIFLYDEVGRLMLKLKTKSEFYRKNESDFVEHWKEYSFQNEIWATSFIYDDENSTVIENNGVLGGIRKYKFNHLGKYEIVKSFSPQSNFQKKVGLLYQFKYDERGNLIEETITQNHEKKLISYFDSLDKEIGGEVWIDGKEVSSYQIKYLEDEFYKTKFYNEKGIPIRQEIFRKINHRQSRKDEYLLLEDGGITLSKKWVSFSDLKGNIIKQYVVDYRSGLTDVYQYSFIYF